MIDTSDEGGEGIVSSVVARGRGRGMKARFAAEAARARARCDLIIKRRESSPVGDARIEINVTSLSPRNSPVRALIIISGFAREQTDLWRHPGHLVRSTSSRSLPSAFGRRRAPSRVSRASLCDARAHARAA